MRAERGKERIRPVSRAEALNGPNQTLGAHFQFRRILYYVELLSSLASELQIHDPILAIHTESY